ncbi:MAG: trigger factor [Patescibacteria group bacterium]|nr:trigger factor [Patescibacteria group bacterium]
MKINSKKLEKGRAEIFVELSTEEVAPYMQNAARRLGEKSKIKGFRPGKAPYEIIKQNFGDAGILNEALDEIIRATYIEAINKEKLNIIGAPQIDILKNAPNNPLSYKMAVDLMPKVELGDISKITIKKQEVKVGDEKVEQTIKNLAENYLKEKLVNRTVQNKDLAEIDLQLFLDNVLVEGGTSNGHKIIIGEPYYIPDFDKKLIGMKADDKKEFEIDFPKEHYNKNLAGKMVKCKVKIKGVFERELPKINDDFAKTLGKFKNLDSLKKQIKDNLIKEQETKEEQRQELEILDEVIKISTFEEIPESLIKEEVKKMIGELQGNLANQGIKFDDYMSHLKKSTEELQKEFLPQAEKRVKTALSISEYAYKNKMTIDEKNIKKEIEKMLSQYPDNNEIQEKIKSENYKNYLRNIMINKKVIKKWKKIISE